MTLLDVLSSRAAMQPSECAFVFLDEHGEQEDAATFQQLEDGARAVAASLRGRAEFGERVVLCYPPGLEFVRALFGCLYAGLVAVPLYPPRPRQKLDRLYSVLSSCEASLILTDSSVRFDLTENPARIAHLGDGRLIRTDELPRTSAQACELPTITEETLAFLQYTSGSTGEPKGVMVSHGNIMANMQALHEAAGCSAEDVFVNWLPVFHDLGLINTILLPIHLGARSVLMAPLKFIQRPRLWLEAITRYRGSIAGAPNFAYDLCLERIGGEELAGLDLRSWRIAFNAAEPINARTLDDFAAFFAPAGFREQAFYPSYGMAEATVFLTAGKPGRGAVLRKYREIVGNDAGHAGADKREKVLVGCGATQFRHALKIVDPREGTELPDGAIGEIWVSGPSIAQGYWNLEARTRETFGQILAGDERRWLRTGDLGCYRDGELYVTGRIKDVIVVHGQNYYPSDIERTVQESHPALKKNTGAVFSVDVDGEELLIVVQEVSRAALREFDPEAIYSAVLQGIAREFELEVHAIVLIKPASLRRTSSGKVQRTLCKQQYVGDQLAVVSKYDRKSIRSSLAHVPPATELEKRLVEVLGEALNADSLGVTDNLLMLGADSLTLTRAVAQLDARLAVRVPVSALFEHPTIRELADSLARSAHEHGSAPETLSIPRADRSVALPISLAQERLWFLWSLHGSSPSYNEFRVVKLPAHVRVTLLLECLNELLQRHEILRTNFVERAGAPVQVIAACAALSMDTREVGSEAQLQTALHEEIHRPFDLARDLLVRVNLFHRSDDRWLSIMMHHMVTDGWSVGILVKELNALYGARMRGEVNPLAPLSLQYADYAAWQRNWLQGEVLEKQLSYWRKQLAGLPPVHSLPTERPRPARQTFGGAVHSQSLGQELSLRLRKFCRDRDVTPFMLFQSVFAVMLSRYSGERDIVIGFPIAGREHRQVEPVLGFFVNTLLFRSDLSGNPSFLEYLARCRQGILDAYKHQHVPFEMLVERLNPARSLSHGPLFQIMLAMHEQVDIVLEGERLEELLPHAVPVKHDLELSVIAAEQGISLRWAYNTDLFLPDTIARMAAVFQTMLACFVAVPAQQIHTLEIIDPAEKARLLRDWNESRVDFGAARCVQELFEEQAEQASNRIALIWKDRQLSYAELNRRSNQLAHYLIARGIGPNSLVGLCVQRSVDMLIGLLGILKAGGAYVPLDPDFPSARLDHMVRDTGTRLVVTQTRLLADLPQGNYERLCMDDEAFRSTLQSLAGTNPNPRKAGVDDLAYVIYTSGSTGTPKGVMIEHRSLSNCLAAMQVQLCLDIEDRWLATTTLSFDIAALELLLPLVVGASVVLTEQGRANQGAYLQSMLRDRGITIMQATPATWQLLVASAWQRNGPLKIVCGGEALTQKLKDELLIRSDAVWNVYGPTETTIWSMAHRLSPSCNAALIGRPIANTQVYVLGEGMTLQPVGTPGELYIGGAGIARGYLNQPQLTGKKFVANPFATDTSQRLYKTGDWVRWLPDGNVEFLGRIDEQVKLRGFRIELGEIEHQLSKIEGVQGSVVLCRQDEGQEKRLVAYVVPSVALEGEDEEVLLEQKRGRVAQYIECLKARLPHYMVPGVFVFLEQFPLSPNGKVDRRRLSAPGEGDLQKQAYVAPRNETEAKLCAIWQEVLGVEQVSIHDDFFTLGGHSLLATRLISLVRERFAFEVPLRHLFEQPSIAEFSTVFDTKLRIEKLARNRVKVTESAGAIVEGEI